MTALQILAAIRRLGGDLRISEMGKLQVVGRDCVPDDLVEAARGRAADLKAIVREHLSTGSASDAVIAAARLLRDGKWGYSPMSCDFHVGRAREDCRRCGAGFASHARTGRGR